MTLRLYGRAPRTGPAWYCRLWHWRQWQDTTSGTEMHLAGTPSVTVIRCPLCKTSFTVSIVWAARASR